MQIFAYGVLPNLFSIVRDEVLAFRHEFEPRIAKFNHERTLIDRLKESGTQPLMYSNDAGDDLLR